MLWFHQGNEGGGTSSPPKGTARLGMCKLISRGDAEGLASPDEKFILRPWDHEQDHWASKASTRLQPLGSLSQDSSTSSHPLSPFLEQTEPPGQAPTTMLQERE